MKNVLFITYFFPPLGGPGVPRSLKFAKHLPGFGWKPIVISATESINYTRDYSLLREIPREIEVHRVGHRKPSREWKYARTKLRIAFDFPDIFGTWYSPAYRQAKWILQKEKVDLIFSSSGPVTSHFIAMNLKKEFNIPWVADFRDPWSGNDTLDLYYDKTLMHPLRKILASKIKNAERDILKTTDKTTVVSWLHKQQLCELHQVTGNKIEVITNGYDESDFAHIKRHDLYPEKLTITFTGSFYSGFKELALDFLDTIRQLDREIEVVLIGRASSEMKGVGADNLTCIYNIPRQKMLALSSASDFLLLLSIPSTIWCIPGKIFEYLRLGRPILALVPEGGDAARIIKEADAGFVLPYGKEKMKEQLKEIFKKYKDGTFKDSQTNYEYISQFERRRLTERLAKVFDKIIR